MERGVQRLVRWIRFDLGPLRHGSVGNGAGGKDGKDGKDGKER